MADCSVLQPFFVEGLAEVAEQHLQVENGSLGLVVEIESEVVDCRRFDSKLFDRRDYVAIVASENQRVGLGGRHFEQYRGYLSHHMQPRRVPVKLTAILPGT